MDLTYCIDKCPIGQAAKAEFLAAHNSVSEAVSDFKFFAHNCFMICPHKAAHLASEEVSTYADN